MSEARRYGVAIIGSAQGGKPLATAMAALYRTAIIERKHGGCSYVNEGYTPTKTM